MISNILDINERVKKVWNEEVPLTGKHIIVNRDRLNDFYIRMMIPDFVDFKNKIIVNYGCGGGWLELLLHKAYDIKKSISFDIAKDSIEKAKEVLSGYRQTEFHLIEPVDYMKKMRRRKKDIFLSCECIQHFPTLEYFEGWFNELNSQKYEWIILHYKIIDGVRSKDTVFRENVYATLKDSNRACITHHKHIEKLLTNYKLYKVKANDTKALREAAYFKYDK